MNKFPTKRIPRIFKFLELTEWSHLVTYLWDDPRICSFNIIISLLLFVLSLVLTLIYHCLAIRSNAAGSRIWATSSIIVENDVLT